MKSAIYSPLLTDFYQLTMAYGYWKLGMHEQHAAFHQIFRKNPFHGNYALSCGLAPLVDFLQHWRFQEDDIAYLASLKNARNEAMFPNEFLDYLQSLRFTCDVDAIPEGTVVFPNEPLVRIQGPILQCQLIETALLNLINFQTLIATKASRVCRAAKGEPVIEFGMRRAQGPDGAVSASRAAYVGGCIATSNTLAGKLYDIPVRGTHAHSWVTAFPTELDAFQAYASIMPHNCTLLVDTFNTVNGVKHAIEVGRELRQAGADLLAIRLDSGDMADLSIKARRLLDEAGFEKTGILASNSLDEYAVQALKEKQAKIDSWGVGTNLATAYDHPALDGVYKLAALREKNGQWLYKLKLSEQEVKISNPGRHQIRRFFSGNQYITDVIYDVELGIAEAPEAIVIDPAMKSMRLDDTDGFVDLLQPVMRGGELVQPLESIHDSRKNAIHAVNEFVNTHGKQVYPVALEKQLYELKGKLVREVK